MKPSKPPVLTPIVPPVTFTPFQGLMACAEKFARVAEKRLGVPLWDGDDGLSGVTADILRGFGVPEKAVGLTPRKVAEQCGLKRRNPKRRLKR